ncbi:hypothetical protein FRC08_006566 [Ceratobasidium sp. 394]|nr:hypothetical protein FRC08_006566 [Ceratobasidium sp. 394]
MRYMRIKRYNVWINNVIHKDDYLNENMNKFGDQAAGSETEGYEMTTTPTLGSSNPRSPLIIEVEQSSAGATVL